MKDIKAAFLRGLLGSRTPEPIDIKLGSRGRFSVALIKNSLERKWFLHDTSRES